MGPRIHDMELKDIVDIILKIRAGAYSFEAANPRHEHEWKLWETAGLPEGKTLIPGVISHSTVLVEHPELVAERIGRYAKVVGRENVVAGGDCGLPPSPARRRCTRASSGRSSRPGRRRKDRQQAAVRKVREAGRATIRPPRNPMLLLLRRVEQRVMTPGHAAVLAARSVGRHLEELLAVAAARFSGGTW